jgi:hypothetical protein
MFVDLFLVCKKELEPGKAYSEGPRGFVDEFAHADSAAGTLIEPQKGLNRALIEPS